LFDLQLKDKPHRIIKAGEAFYELDGDLHVWGGNASNSTTCKVVASVFGRPNEDVNTFVFDYERETRGEAIALARQAISLA